jgi:hypothetical protein
MSGFTLEFYEDEHGDHPPSRLSASHQYPHDRVSHLLHV